ncbi:MAG: PIN domain nuclease [Oscillospiraceae bacterium]|jgi:predicted nucleic acid-binding protein|nr:PIN domain nuclease [Oscillospiraceae bacterium]
MRKIKIYFDTSVLSHFDQADAPEKTAETLELLDILKTREDVQIVLSNVVFDEVGKCPEPKLSRVLEKIETIDYLLIQEDDDHKQLVQIYLENKVLTGKSTDDLRHIAIAVLSDCDIIVSWNFKHFVNVKTIDAVNTVNIRNYLPQVKIVSPQLLLGGF